MALVSAGKLSCANVLDDDLQNISTKCQRAPSVFIDLRVCYLVKILIEGNLWVAIVLGGKI